MVVRQLIALPSQMQLIDRLQHHIYLSSSLIFLSSQAGAGKSSLIEQLSNKLQANTKEAYIKLNSQLSDAQIRQQVLVQLYDNPLFDAQDSLLSSLWLLQEKHNISAPRLIIFDNAHLLSDVLLKELAELIAHKGDFGEHEINILLLAENVKSLEMFSSTHQLCHCLEFKLEPLSQKESEQLLKHLFNQVGYQHQVQHQDAVVKKLMACQGNPRKIITLAEKIIAGKLVYNELSWIKTRLPAILVMLLLLLIAGGLGSYLYPLLVAPKEVSLAIQAPSEIKNEPLESEQPDILVSDSLLPEKPEISMAEQLAGNWNKVSDAEVQPNHLMVGISDPVSTENNPKILVPIDVQISEQIPVFIEEQKSEAVDTVEQVVVEGKVDELANQPVKKEQPDSIFTAESVLLSITPSHYTIQLSALTTKASLQRFIVQHKDVSDNIQIYETVYNNKPRYIVIFGDYDTLSDANKAAKNLPGSLLNLDTWVKKYQLVHQDLQLNK